MAKKAKEETTSKGKLQDALDKLNKSYGIGAIITLDSKSSGVYDTISTGSIGFDYITLGVGGFVKGKMYELMGWEGVGKSSVCGHAAAECQKAGGTVVYIDGEHALDKNYFQALGVDTSKMYIAQPSTGEEGFNIAIEMANTGEVDLIIIDSDSSLIPKAVVDGDVGESAIGKKARLNSNAYPKLKTALERNKTCVIVVSQYREKIGILYGNPTTTQGGHALKFYSDCRIEISKTAAKDKDFVYGNITKVKATKNKMSPPYRKSEFEIVYGKGIDKVKEIMELMNEFEIGRKYGSSMTYNEVKYDLDNFKQLILDNEEFYEQLRTDIINKIKNTEIEIIEEEETNESN